MPFCDHRMLEGGPLHYYTPATPGFVPATNTFSFFNRFQCYGSSNMTEDVIMPHSPPNGFQSDSDNSVSSVDISPKELRARLSSNGTKAIDDVQCQWVSCGILFESLDQLATHVGRVHASSGSDGLFYCGWEGCSRNHKGFNARYKMLVHVRTHTNEKPHRCAQCEKSFSRAENLKIHSRSHSGEKPYACPVPGCQKAYSNSSDRFKHTRTHQVDKPYQCKVAGCPKRYTDPSSLRKHVKTYKHFVNSNKSKQETGNVAKNETERCGCKTEEFVELDAYSLENGRLETWNMILNPYIPQPRLFKPYELDERMDVDLPLDLSLTRRHV